MFALFLACVMLFSATPVQAFAQEDTSYLIEETNPQEDVNLIEDTGLTETVNLGEDINLSGDTGPSEGTELSENTNTTEDSELIIEGEESEANPLETEGEESEANPTETEGEEAIEETVQTEMEDPIDDTELLEGTETTENLQPEETLPKDITNCMDQLTLSMKKWWYEDQENTVDVTEEKYVDFSEFIQDPDEPVWAGVSLKYEAVGFQEGDWFTVVLPEQFEDVQIEEGFVFPEGMEGSLKELEEPEQGTELTMRFSTVEETFDGELPLQFRLSALEDVSILLQEDADRQNEYVVIPPFAETEQEGMVGVFSLRSGKAETNTFSIKGEIVFDENLGGTDWRSILRPLEFDQNIKLIATYQDASGVDHTVEYYAQDSAPQDAFYLMMTHDGEGGGSFEIINVPKNVTLENGFNAEVTKYNVSVYTQYPYYENENGGFDVTDTGATQTVSTLRLKVKSQNLTLDPNVVGDQTPATFPMDVTFTKSSGAVTEQSTLSKTVNPTNTAPTIIQVPVGIGFKVVQNQVEGYKLDPQYTITTETVGSEPVSDTKTGEVTGTIVEGTNVTVTTKNYMQNLTYPLSVIWVDNNNSGRPVLGESSFKLQYKTESGEWTDLTEASKETLGIDNLPTFDASNAALGKYVYRGLPSIDAEGNSLSYQVVPFDLPGYTVSADATNSKFTYRQTTTFNATISWMDSDNADNKRPDALPLNLYRRAANGSYELVSEDVPINKNSDNTWSVSVSDLPRYNDSNQEYDYVLVQGTIGENNSVTQTTIDSYKTFYDNGTGNYGNDIALCHNNGTISQRISGEVAFSAVKKWKDNGNISDRPETTVTLWRYSVLEAGDTGIDSMYNQNLAAQVIYRMPTNDESGNQTYKDVLLSYQLKNQNSETITFDHSTVSDLPDDFRLPAYDEQGRRYVYFVRETVDSEYYETTYTSSTGDTLAQGAPNNGSITNTRREKSEVNITKIWQCPSNLPDIEGLSVQMTILAPDQNNNYEELTVYSADLNSFRKLNGGEKTAAQTLSGFAESIATLDLQFYVNIYDENGLPYDMTKAVIQEIKVLDKNKNEIDVSYSGEANLGTGTFTLKGNQYTAVSAYINQTVLADGMKQYQYKETNTISGTRNYTLIKEWQGFSDDELANYASVSFRLTRRSSKDGAQDETVQTPEGENTWVVSNQEELQWQRLLENLPKYDNQGYEYLYSATEVAVTDVRGNPVSQNWFSYHYRTENSTTVTNYKGTGGGGALYVAKTWMDNGDTKTRKAVSVRIYRKSDVLTALADKSENEIVSLGNLGIGYASCQLSGGNNNWFCEVALAAVETGIVTNGGSPAQSNLGAEDYLILEYQVGGETDGAVPASYAVSQLRAAARTGNVYTVSGTVSNSLRQYQTVVNRADNGTMVTITNTRIGQASLEITKNWKDENNAGGQRPNSVQFQVYQDGQVYIPGEDSGIGSIINQEHVSATWNRDTGIITMSYAGNANTAYDWKLRLENLPLFSETGVPHTYNVEEIVGTGQTGSESQTGGTSSTGSTVSSSYYLTTKDNITVTPHTGTPDRVTYGFTFDNTLTGTTVHSAHKTWNDIDSGGFDRPDLYLTLYRYLKSDAQANPDKPVDKLGSFRKYTDCEDPIWTVDNAYHWRAEVGDLPLYDDQGREYVYRFQEALNNNGVTVYGTYMQTAQYHLEVECETCKNLNISYSTPYDKFTNTLTDNMTVSGVKTWKGFEGYEIEAEDYPQVTIELYRSLNPNINPLNKKDTDAEFQQWKNSGTIQYVSKVVLSFDAQSNSYPTTYSFGTGSNPLPKFNGEGRRWYYSIREVFPNTIADSLYTENFDNGTLTNVFLKNGNRRTIQVMKTWNRGQLLENEKDKYPSVTYYLYRYEEGVSPENAALLKSIQVSANDVAANANWAATGEGQEKPPLCEFKDLLIYSPSGKPYYYYVTEKAISGYSISYSDEAGIGEGYSGNGRSDVISIPENPFTQESDHTVKVGTTNTYDNPGSLNISGKKYWNDYGNSDLIYGKRPDSIEVTLKRYTQNESGQANMISEETIDLNSGEKGKPQIVWEKELETEPNFWKYTITNLERYAPNGMPYIYSVTETPVDGYKQSNGTVTGTAGATGDLNLNVLTNSLGTTYYVRKNWMDGNNKYGLRPTSITVVLQRSNDGGANWKNIQWEDSFGSYNEATKKWTGLPSVTTDENGNNIVSIRLTADYVMNNTRGNSWQYTFTNLPEKDKDGKIWTYRCIETKIDNAAVEEKNNIFKAGAYTCTYPIQDDAKTVIQNKLESTSLHVTKNWEGDQNDLYHSRPDSITFVLQMRGIVQTDTPSVSPESGGTSGESGGTSGEPGGSEGDFDLSDWQNVKVDGRDTFTISKADNWQKTLQDLPVAIVGEDGRTYYTLYFRAVEKHADDTVDENGNTVQGSKVLGAQNYLDTTDYRPESKDHSYNVTLSRNESTITNQLILDEPAKAISVTKNWKRQEGVPVTATFELLYKTEDEAQWHCYGDGLTLPINKNGDLSQEPDEWSNHTEKAGCVLKTVTSTTATQQTVIWSNLPKYDRNGDELEYCVVEHPLEGYGTETEHPTQPISLNTLQNNQDPVMYNYKITNIELQSYTVKKVWQNTDYAEKADSGFTATFKLQQKVEGGEWEDVKDEKGKTKICTLISTSANDDTKSETWEALPKYTTDGKEISYRAVETDINGKPVSNNTNGSYIVTYQYYDGNEVDGKTVLKNESAFADIGTVATNRMVYGFVNLSKAAAYLAPGVTPDGSKKLKNVVFDIYSGTGTTKTLYASGIKTDENGNLIRNDDGTYGTGHKYLISGKYTLMEPLMEPSTNPGYSVWEDGVTFTVGVNGPEVSKNKDTGEHGTAWISTNITSKSGSTVLNLKAEYKSSGKSDHTFDNDEGCVPQTNSGDAYNLESRGVIKFTKTGPDGTTLDTHASATGESKAYFGVYTDAACTEQVAGMMADSTGTNMVLTTLDKNGTDKKTEFCSIKNTEDIPYLRKGTDNVLTLLSGTYYLKELVAPPGYKLDNIVDNIVRKAIVPEIQQNNGSNTYANNKASIMLTDESSGNSDYQWANTENQVTLYKRDQYGRQVNLGENGYLELKVGDEGNTFLTGENTIRLYQNAAKPAAKANGSAFEEGRVPNIVYDSTTGTWTIKGLFDIGKTYTLSEPNTSVPVNNIQAEDFSFTMGADGKITVSSADAESKDNPLAVTGKDYKNYYKSDTGNNVVVFRDVARYLTDVALEKVDKNTETIIANISFELYKMTGTNDEGNEVYESVLENGEFLTTDSNGVIRLSDTNGYKNLITSCDLKYGLDVGKYYFQEIERGASDIYRLMDKIYFEIKPKDPGENPGSYEDYATVEFQDTEDGSVSQTSGEHSATVKNTPVTEKPKTLQLTKVDCLDNTEKLSGAQFTLTYTSITDGQNGAQTQQTYNCKTDTDGVLYLCNDTGTFDNPKVQPDISRKGTYVLVETQAPDYYMTRTPETRIKFNVSSENAIKVVECTNPLISAKVVPEAGEHNALELTAKNEKTVVSIAKRNDIENNTKTSNQKSLNGEPLSGATLEIYEGMYNKDASPAQIPVKSWTSDAAGNWSVDPGTLKENTVYTLHESQAPVGYLPAKDIYFKLFGTTTKDSKVVSKLYVWTGSETPTLNGSNWSESSSIKDTMLTMVDEAIIAPVDLQKVVGEGETYKALSGAEFEVKSLDGEGTILGTAVSDSNGHLVWKTVTNPNELIFNSSRKRITDSKEDKSSMIGEAIILRQNSNGYLFTETDAPDHAYNKGESFTVKIKAKNYTDYRDGGYQADVYVDIMAANRAADKTVSELTIRENTPANTDLVNPPFKAAFELYKYDAEHYQINTEHNNYGTIGLQGVTFMLYKQADGSYPQTGTEYTTGENGLLHIDLTEKGTYKLVETNPLTGYKTNSKVMEFTIINEDYKKTVTYSDTGENHTVAVRDENESPIANTKVYDLPNERLHGTVTLTKQDANSDVKLNGVKYSLRRTDPSLVNTKVDKWFPSDGNSSITVETGYTYTVVASAADEAAFLAGKKDTGTSAPGVLVIEDLQWGTYTLVEQQENNGYILDTKTLTFIISADGLTQTVLDNGNEFVTNTKNQLTIQKTALDGTTPLSGAEFKLYPVTKSSTEESMDNDPTKFFTTASAQTPEGTVITAGETTIYGLTKGTYVLRETKAPDGYELTKDVIFTMLEDGTVKNDITTCTVGENNKINRDSSGDSVVTLTTSGTGTAIVNNLTVKDTPIEVSLTKAVSNGTLTDARGDASYEITGIFAGKTTQETRTFKGNIITDSLKAQLIGGNSYTITEKTAPAGYEVQKNSATLHVATDGKITVTGGDSFLTADNTTGTAKLTFTDDPIELTLSKTDVDGNTINEAVLGYATFKITGKFVKEDGSRVEQNVTIEGLRSDDFKTKLSKRLIGGEIYRIEETAAPKGYKLADPFYIQIDEHGEIIKRGTSENTMVSVNSATDTLIVEDEPTMISFKKVEDGNKPLAGAKFTLTGSEFVVLDSLPSGVSWTDDTHKEITWTSTTDVTTLTNLLIANVNYTLSEERVPYHEVMSQAIIFHLTEKGKIVITQNSSIPNNSGLQAASISDNGNGIEMTIQNPIIKGMVTLTKYWKEEKGANNQYDDDHLLADAVYTLTRIKDANGDIPPEQVKTTPKTVDSYAYSTSGTVDRFITDANGKIVITGLPEGTYEFLEVDAPEAYHINNEASDKIQFTIINDSGANVVIPADEKVMDTRINAKISLTKFQSNGTTLLSNAVFDVAYSETRDGTYTSIGSMITGADGKATFSQGKYPGCESVEGLRRGFYRLTELSANGQMLNTADGARNTITFEIGNEIDKEYVVKSGTDVTYTVGGSFITLTENGVKDTPIPTKSVTVKKVWAGDTGLDKTFRPESIEVQLYRSYNGGAPVAVAGSNQTLNSSNNWTYTWTDLPAYVNDGTGTQRTYLYTYTVQEVDPKSWYSVTYSDVTATTETQNPRVEDGDTTSTVTNALQILGTGTSERKKLTIRKTLGGGSADDVFKVRIILTKDGNSVGNNGYYLDPCTLTKADNTTAQVIPDTNGWIKIHGGESITLKLPVGVTYTVEEETTSGTVKGTSHTDLTYTPRYDSYQSGTIATADATTTIRNAVHKSLDLVKQDETSTSLSGAEFEITYTPLDGSSYVGTAYKNTFTTNADGKLLDSDGKPIDLTNQGTYTIKEIKAPDGYITPTDNNGNPIVLATITVNADDVMSVYQNSLLATVNVENNGSQASVTVKNEKTKARIGKTIDYAAIGITTDTAEGSNLSGASLKIMQGGTVKASWSTTTYNPFVTGEGVLKEGEVYKLVEESSPTGYAKAADVYFKLEGTYTEGGNRYSRIVITDAAGKKIDQNTNGSVYGDSGVVDGILKLVDETIIAPVDLRKVLQESENTWTSLENVEFRVSDGTTTFGTAITNDRGYLIWKNIQTVTDASGEYLIYDTAGLRVTATGDVQNKNMPVILRQNTAGYQFTETFAPEHAYNDGRTYQVKITEENYKQYRTTSKSAGSLYDSSKYINIVDANRSIEHTVANLSQRDNNTTQFTSANGLAVNLPYKSTVTLHKYDVDEEANNAFIPGTEFTLYHASVSGGTWTKGTEVTDAFVTGITTPNASGVFKTDASGNLSIEIHNKGYYILEETEAATGYELSNVTFQFQLIDDMNKPYGYEKITALKKTNNGVPNERLKGTVTLMKKDSGTQEALDGVVFTLTRTDSPTGISDYLLKTPLEVITGKVYEPVKDSNGIWTWNESVGMSGEIKVIGLNWGNYKLEEKTEKSGYIRSTDTGYSFTVKADELVFHHDVSNKKNQVTFYKTDDVVSPKGLAGAVFEVHEGDTCSGSCTAIPFYSSASETTPVYSAESGADGKVTIYGLPTDTSSNNPKTYHLVETTAPKGYKIASPVSFTIDRSGNVQVNASNVNEVQMKDEPIRLYIKKIGEDSAVTLAGAQFQLTDICTGSCDHKLANGELLEQVTTGANGEVMIPIERVIAGHTYQLKETKAPDGYECTAVVTFKVKEDGTADLLSTYGGHIAAMLDFNKTTFEISNEKIQVSLTKVDYEDPTKKLEGVTFTLKPAEGSGFVESYSGIEADGTVKLATDSSGKVSIPLELMKHDNSYILTETSLGSHSSYRLAEHEADRQITFKVEKGGTITITNPNAMFKLAQDENGLINAAALIVSNQKITLTVDKQDQATGQKLKDVTLKLSKRDTSGNWNPVSLSGITDADGQWTTDDTGAVTFKGDNFTPGTYKLEEVSTPEGYNSIAGPLTFTIDQSGKVTEAAVGNDSLTGLTGNSWKDKNFTITNPTDGEPGKITLNVSNAAYTDLKIIKEGSDGVFLNSVEFRLDYLDGTQWKYVNLDDNGKAIVTSHVLTSGGVENAKRTTDTNGIVTFSGLPNGKYRLTELKTAQGYNLLSAPLEIEIDRNGEIYKVSYNGGTGLNLTRGSGTNTISLTVINQKGFVLPATGTTTPKLPKAVLGWIALMEGLVLYQYQSRGKRRKRKG